jgi:hypothetical protein
MRACIKRQIELLMKKKGAAHVYIHHSYSSKKNEFILSDQGNYAFPLLGINVVCFSSPVIFDFFLLT